LPQSKYGLMTTFFGIEAPLSARLMRASSACWCP
jgi:hypothetical protein